MSEKPDTESKTPTPSAYGIFAEYETPHALIEASKKVRDDGYTKWDTMTPFPVHGIDPAMGIKPTVLPWLVLCAGLTGCASALLLQWWTNAVDYPFTISGKPYFSIPANIPITFELTVLFSALTAFFGMLGLNRLPEPSHPIHLNPRLARASDDRFFILIQSSDPKFDSRDTRELLESTKAVGGVGELAEDTSSNKVPRGFAFGLLIIAAVAMLPLSLAAVSRASTSTKPQFHIVPDMDWQTKYKAQRPNDFFADGRASRPPVEGTVAVGELRDDDHLYRGKSAGAWARTLPPSVQVDDVTMARGKQRFGIYCTPCHGENGLGQGAVHQRVQTLNPTVRAQWVPPANLTLDNARYMPVGQVFDVITNGIRNMQGYGGQIPPEDRWAIVLYLRALQRAQTATVNDVPMAARTNLK